MAPDKKLSGISVFFPCYNDEHTIAQLVDAVMAILPAVALDWDVTVVNDGSRDGSAAALEGLKHKYGGRFGIVTHERNLGYGAALKSGFAAASREFVFYTDGDAQYEVRELPRLVERMADEVDVVNGKKGLRADSRVRGVIGKAYHRVMSAVFFMPQVVEDVDCDFRLIRTRVFDEIELNVTSGAVCVEMMKKISAAGFRIVTVPVTHLPRRHGRSESFRLFKILEMIKDIPLMWVRTVLWGRGRS